VNIEYIQYRNINFHKWDECVSRSLNGLVYAYSWYLDIVAGEWDALVADDYSIIFPLVKGSKYGIPYLYQPYFTQQLGVFSPIKVDSQTTKLFTDSIPAKFKYRIINFNSFNHTLAYRRNITIILAEIFRSR